MMPSGEAKNLTTFLNQGRNVLITGQAGTGKSTLIRQLAESEEHVVLTATTGVAALTLGGRTIHSFTGINIQTSPEYAETLARSPKWRSKTAPFIRQSKIVVIDECSMLRPDTFALIDAVLRKATESSQVFGGKKIVMSGDILQLPPVIKPEERLASPWIFQTPLWNAANFAILHLTENHRQDDPLLAQALSEIRRGSCPPWVNELFAARRHISKGLRVAPVRFVPKNAQADEINRRRLEALSGEPRIFRANVNGQTEWLRAQIKEDCIAQELLMLKRGAQVMVLTNDDKCKPYRYINGSMGTIVDFSEDGYPEVEIAKTGEVITFEPHTWERKDCQGVVLASFEQVPLKPAYAVTIHKSQGLTLDAAEIDCAGIFTGGQAYVGLSRVRTLDGLRLLNWDKGYIAADPDALEFYASLGG